MSPTDQMSWHTLSIFQQMGNISSEVSRALKAQELGNIARRDSALSRMIDLFSASKSDLRWHHQSALSEICRANEVVCDYFYGDNQYESTPENLMGYFDTFVKGIR